MRGAPGQKSARPPIAQPLEPMRSWRQLPTAARVFVAAVCVLGGGIIVYSVPKAAGTHGGLLAAFLILSVPASIVKVSFPRSASTLTVGQLLDYLTLMTLGPQAAVLVAATGAWGQCTFRSRYRNPRHQTLFSISCLACAVQVAGSVYVRLGGQPGAWEPSALVGPLAAAATILFVLNSGLIATAIGLSTEQSPVRIWCDTLLWSWPSYLLSAGVAAAALAGVHNKAYWLVPFLGVPLVLSLRTLQAYFERFQESVSDPLTGLPNQRFVLSHAAREMGRAGRSGASLAVVLVDLDGFKDINDTHGHRAGDHVLCEVARCLQQSIRPYDVCARYGGDEFLIVLSNCGPAEARRKVGELQAAVSAMRPRFDHGVRVSAAVSIGTAVFPDDGESLERLLDLADARMYQDKLGSRARALKRVSSLLTTVVA